MSWSWRRRAVTLALGFGMSASVVEAIVQSGGSASATVVAPSQYTSPSPSGSSIPFDTLVALGIVVAFLVALLLFYVLVYRNRGGGGDAEEFDADKETKESDKEESSEPSKETQESDDEASSSDTDASDPETEASSDA